MRLRRKGEMECDTYVEYDVESKRKSDVSLGPIPYRPSCGQVKPVGFFFFFTGASVALWLYHWQSDCLRLSIIGRILAKISKLLHELHVLGSAAGILHEH